MQRLAEIKARAEAATPGPWNLRKLIEPYESLYAGREGLCEIDMPNFILEGTLDINNECPDVNFTIHAREDIPWLIEQVERLQAEAQRKQVALTQIQDLLIGTDFRSRERIEQIVRRARDEG